MPEDNIHSNHRNRIRKRFDSEGLDSFEAHEILELMLQYTIPQMDTNPLAHRLIEHFGSFHGVLDASREELLRIDGVGDRTAVFLRLIPQIIRQYSLDKQDLNICFQNVDEIGNFCVSKYLGVKEEILSVMLLDDSYKLLGFEKLQVGSISCASVNPEKLGELIFRYGASSFVLVHNHPNGKLNPSEADEEVTERIKDIFLFFNRRLLEHFIVTSTHYLPLMKYMQQNRSSVYEL